MFLDFLIFWSIKVGTVKSSKNSIFRKKKCMEQQYIQKIKNAPYILRILQVTNKILSGVFNVSCDNRTVSSVNIYEQNFLSNCTSCVPVRQFSDKVD